MEYYVYAEDLCSALIGPFPTKEAAMEHIKFCSDRGDGAEMEIYSEEQAAAFRLQDSGLIMTPEDDRKDKGLL